MTSVAPTAEQLVSFIPLAERGQPATLCLICLQPATLKPGTNVVAEHRVDNEMIVSCRGSGYVAAQDDGRDAVRVAAIQARHALLQDIAEIRAEMLNHLTAKNWSMAVTVDFYGERLIRPETRARIWHKLASHGDLSTSLREALSVVTRNSTGGLITPDVDRAVVSGTRDWLNEARAMLLSLVTLPGVATELLGHLLLIG